MGRVLRRGDDRFPPPQLGTVGCRLKWSAPAKRKFRTGTRASSLSLKATGEVLVLAGSARALGETGRCCLCTSTAGLARESRPGVGVAPSMPEGTRRSRFVVDAGIAAGGGARMPRANTGTDWGGGGC